MSYTSSSTHDAIHDLLTRTRTIAVIGCSPSPSRPSAQIAAYLRRAGYDVVPVNPTVTDIAGIKAYASLADIPGPVDLVVVFRRSELAAAHVDEAIAKGVRGIWLQDGVTTPDGAEKARAELRRISGRAPASDGLTETERLVAELAAGGRTNREIAAELFMGVSTVEAHLSRIYRKLGVRRAELSFGLSRVETETR